MTPELFVQHAINTAYSRAVGMPAELIALSTVPPTAPPAPKLRLDLPYAVALRELFRGYKFRAQQNTRYIEADTMEATVTHVLDTLISRLTSADIQSTITPDEGRNIPWHYNNVAGVNTARQTLDGARRADGAGRAQKGWAAARSRSASSKSAPCCSSKRSSRAAAITPPSRRGSSSTRAISRSATATASCATRTAATAPAP